MQRCALLVLLALAFNAAAAEITLDGKLDEPVWKKTEKHTGFMKAKTRPGADVVKAQTEFYVVSKPDRIYFGIKCDEPKMKEAGQLPGHSLWVDDGLEIFLGPSGQTWDFYQFRLTVNNMQASLFYSEGGAIQPDPYAPEWRYAIYRGQDFWSCEVEFPLTAFYMTRQNLWNTEWLVNVCRTRTPEKESTSWSPILKGFKESEHFRKIKGFPMRKPADDVWVSDAKAVVNSVKDGSLTGQLLLTVNVPETRDYLVNGKKFTLQPGANQISVPYQFAKSGRNEIPIVCKRIADNKDFVRKFPVYANYEPLKIHLTKPEYRNNFYPGQDSSRVSGRIEKTGNGSVTLTLSGDGFETRKKILDRGQDFSFDTTGFKIGGTAELKAEMNGIVQTVRIRNLAPSKHRMSWISNGALFVDGKPVLTRVLAAEGYRGGKAFDKKYNADNLHATRGLNLIEVYPRRLIKGIEEKEATKDVRPCDELFRKIDQVLEKNRDLDYTYIYICDEPECRNISPEYLGYVYRYVAEKDPYHVVRLSSREPDRYINCADWFEPHPYINPVIFKGQRRYGREINTVGKFLDKVSLLNRPDKCVGLNSTAFSGKYKSNAADYPNFREIICHIWAGMNHGGKTLRSYAYHDLGDRPCIYEGTRYMYSSFEALQDLVLFAKRTFLIKTPDCEAVLYEHGKDRMFVIVNMTTKKIKASLKGLQGSFVEFRGSRKFDTFDFELEPQEVIIGTSRKMDQGLKTRAEVAAEIDRLEEARKNRGNILFDRQNEIVVTSSNAKPSYFTGSYYKLFDGTVDVLADAPSFSRKSRFYELAFPKFIPEFTCIRVFGYNIENMTVKIRKRGKWLTLKPDKIQQEEFMCSMFFKEKIRTVKIRFEFPKNRIELYEIELLK